MIDDYSNSCLGQLCLQCVNNLNYWSTIKIYNKPKNTTVQSIWMDFSNVKPKNSKDGGTVVYAFCDDYPY